MKAQVKARVSSAVQPLSRSVRKGWRALVPGGFGLASAGRALVSVQAPASICMWLEARFRLGKNVIFLAVFLFGYTVQAITGFAGNIFCMPVGTFTLGLQSSVSILNATGFLACTVLAVLNFRSIHWRELGKIVGVMLPFVALGAWLDSVVPLHALLKIYGLVILAVGIKNLVQRKQSFLPEWALWGVLAAAGLIQGMFVSGGALLVIYAVQKLTDKEQFRATLSAVWSILNLLYAGVQLYQGHFTGEVWVMVACCIPLIVLATVVGGKLAERISQERFLKLTYVLLLFIGAVLLITS